MADNTTLNPGVGGDTIREVEKAGAKTQVVILDMGGSGAEDLSSTPATQATLASVKAKTDNIPAQGQALAAASVPVVLTVIQQAALTPPAAIAGFALEAGHLATIDTSTAKIPSQGQALAAASMPVVLTAAQVATLTPLSSITANAGSNLNTSALALEAGNLATLVAKDYATETTLEALGTTLGATDDEEVRPDEAGSISARLLAISIQMEEMIDVQKEGNEILFLILNVLSEPKTELEVN